MCAPHDAEISPADLGEIDQLECTPHQHTHDQPPVCDVCGESLRSIFTAQSRTPGVCNPCYWLEWQRNAARSLSMERGT